MGSFYRKDVNRNVGYKCNDLLCKLFWDGWEMHKSHFHSYIILGQLWLWSWNPNHLNPPARTSTPNYSSVRLQNKGNMQHGCWSLLAVQFLWAYTHWSLRFLFLVEMSRTWYGLLLLDHPPQVLRYIPAHHDCKEFSFESLFLLPFCQCEPAWSFSVDVSN